MKFLIAGFGSIGRRHFRNLLALGARDIIFLRSKRSTLEDDEISEYLVETDIDAALSHHPDAVIISTPTALHLDAAIPAAEMGCHLFLEKPISHSMERIDELQTAVHRGGGQVFVGFQFRFHPGLQKIVRILEGESIGRPLSVRAHWGEYLPGWHPWEDYRKGYSARSDLGGGVTLTLCHPLDYLRWMFGEVESLWAFTGQLNDLALQVEDTSEIGLRFSSGMIGSVHLNFNQRPPSHRLEIVGTKGTIRWDNDEGIIHLFSADTDKWEHITPSPDFARNDLFLKEMEHFLQVIKMESEPLCTLDDGVAALQLALAAHKSSENKLAVSINRQSA